MRRITHSAGFLTEPVDEAWFAPPSHARARASSGLCRQLVFLLPPAREDGTDRSEIQCGGSVDSGSSVICDWLRTRPA